MNSAFLASDTYCNVVSYFIKTPQDNGVKSFEKKKNKKHHLLCHRKGVEMKHDVEKLKDRLQKAEITDACYRDAKSSLVVTVNKKYP